MKKIIYITLGICTILIIGGIIASNYAVGFVLRSLGTSNTVAESKETEAKNPEPASSNQSQTREQETASGVTTSGSGDKEETKAEPEATIPSGKSEQALSKSDSPADKDIGKESSNEGTKNDLKYSAEVSNDKAKKVEESITLQEKAQVTAVLLRKLSASEIQLFMKLASDGLTVQEKREAKKIILQKLTEDEYNQLISIAAKYGLSQGKSYKDSQKEVP